MPTHPETKPPTVDVLGHAAPRRPERIPGGGHPPGPPTGRGGRETPPPKKGAPNHVILGYVGGPVGGIPKILFAGSRDASAGWERPLTTLDCQPQKSQVHKPPTGRRCTASKSTGSPNQRFSQRARVCPKPSPKPPTGGNPKAPAYPSGCHAPSKLPALPSS